MSKYTGKSQQIRNYPEIAAAILVTVIYALLIITPRSSARKFLVNCG